MFTAEDIERRLFELRSEQKATVDPRKKAIIRAEVSHWMTKLRDMRGYNNQLGGVGSRR